MEKTLAIALISSHFSIPEKAIWDLLTGTKTQAPKKIVSKPKAPKTNEDSALLTEAENQNEHKHQKKAKYYFLIDDYNALLAKMNSVVEEIKRLGEEIGESCSDSETFHDNFDYEEGGRQQKMWTEHFMRLKKIKENAEILTSNDTTNFAGIGNVIEMETATGEKFTKRIGSYITFSDNDISYRSPLAKALIKKKVGDIIHANHKTFTIKSIN